MASGLRILSAGSQPIQQLFFSADVDFITMDWTQRLSAESISASGTNGGFVTWYFPAGFTAFLSGTAVGASGIWCKLSATGAPMANTVRASAKVTTTSGKNLSEWFDVMVWSGQT